VLNNIGDLYLKQRRWSEASPLFDATSPSAQETSVRPSRWSPSAHLNLAEAFEPLGRVREAREALEIARRIYGRGPGYEIRAGSRRARPGSHRARRGKRAAAVSYLERAVTLWEAGGFDPAKVTEARALLKKARAR
jgi:tetratricopeptide (TPR) repeat protein